MPWLFARRHWASVEEGRISKLPLDKAVEKQVEKIRELNLRLPDSAVVDEQAAGFRTDEELDTARGAAEPSNAGRETDSNGSGSDAQDLQRQEREHSNGIHRYGNSRPAELELPPVDDEEYRRYRALSDIREPYRIPREYLQGTKDFLGAELPDSPLVVFINSRSGGRAGPRLAEVLCHAIGHSQVYDLQDHRPGPVLQKMHDNLAAAAAAGDAKADYFRWRLRILAAGGDGTVAWVLGTIAQLRLDPPPLVAVMPLGTGNDLSLTFGWGNAFLPAWLSNYGAVYHLLRRIADAEPRQLDCWRLSVTAGGKRYFDDLPYSLQPADEHPAGAYKVHGLFWNYLSVGMDAKAAHGFHALRESKPWAARGRFVNQAWYAYYGFESGWMFRAPALRDTASLFVRTAGAEELEEVAIPGDVKAIVVLNLQSYGGGRDLFGLATDPHKLESRGYQVPIFNDGLLEVVGLKGGWHTGVILSGLSNMHAVRLAQVPELLIRLRGPSAKRGVTHMQLDGEPWRQHIPTTADSDAPFEVHVSHAAMSHMLMNAEKLPGIAPKVQRLAARQAAVSAVLSPQPVSPPPEPLRVSVSLPIGSNSGNRASQQDMQKAMTDDPSALHLVLHERLAHKAAAAQQGNGAPDGASE